MTAMGLAGMILVSLMTTTHSPSPVNARSVHLAQSFDNSVSNQIKRILGTPYQDREWLTEGVNAVELAIGIGDGAVFGAACSGNEIKYIIWFKPVLGNRATSLDVSVDEISYFDLKLEPLNWQWNYQGLSAFEVHLPEDDRFGLVSDLANSVLAVVDVNPNDPSNEPTVIGLKSANARLQEAGC